VVGMAAAGLPDDQRRQAILWGIGAATILRIAFASVTVQLLQVVGIVLAGGVLLLERSGAAGVHLDVEHALMGNLESLVWLRATGWSSLVDPAALATLPPQLARLAGTVVAVEEDETLAAEAARLLSEEGVDNAYVVTGPLAAGSAKHAPYDVITVQGGVETVPDALLAQLKDGGRIGAIFMDG
ncbi:MAG: TerC family protein, partial [Allosphingosinicella sp.]